MQKKRRLKKYAAVCYLAMFICAAPVLAASEVPGNAGSSKQEKRPAKDVIISLKDPRVASPSPESPLLEFADNLFLEKKIVSPQRAAVKESKWSITPLLNRMTLSSLGDPKNIGVVWKYRF
jgi:hypothetical protein